MVKTRSTMPGRGGSSQSGHSSNAKDRNRNEGSCQDTVPHTADTGGPPSPPPRQKRDSGALTEILIQIKDLRQDFASLKGHVENLDFY